MSLVSRRATYGLRTMYRLAERAAQGGGATIAWLARTEHLPRKYLDRVLRDLKQGELVISKPGPGGGCRLARPADQITVGDVVRVLDGQVQPVYCLEDTTSDGQPDCPTLSAAGECAMRETWVRLRGAIDEVLDSVTIADLVARQQALDARAAADYHI